MAEPEYFTLDPNDPYSLGQQRQYQLAIEREHRTFQLQSDYGKWLVSSLLLVSGAGIGFVANNDRLSNIMLPWGYAALCAALFFAFAAGLLAWVNWSKHAELHMTEASTVLWQISHLKNENDEERQKRLREEEEQHTKDARFLTITTRLSVGAGILSLLCVLLAAGFAAWKLSDA